MIASRNNDFFENATEYKPERWLNSTGEFSVSECPGSSIVLPFGCGKRICPGKKYVELELMILVVKLVKNFKFTFKSEFEQQFEFVLAPKGPVNVQFCDR
jgi:ecdysone 20-monooxygenase